MSDRSPRLDLPYLLPSQAQKHVTHNEALQHLDALVQLCVEGFGQDLPPAQPEEGHVYALGANPTGAWAGQEDRIAAFQNGSWSFFAPQVGWRAYGRGEGAFRIWTGTAWQAPVPELDNLDGVGIGTSADALNRLSVAAGATLLSHDGAGHQLKLNKATPNDTASLLFQTDWSGRAEMGLAGNDAFAIKVSPDGSTWHSGLALDPASGAVTTSEMTISGGLSLGGTAPENRMAVYETGTYGPALIDMSGNSVSLAPKQIPFIRIGDHVSLFFNFMSNLDTAGLVPGDDVAITLPFTIGAHSFASVELGGPVGKPGPYHWYATSGQAYARIRSLDTHATLSVADLSSGATDIVGGTLTVSLT